MCLGRVCGSNLMSQMVHGIESRLPAAVRPSAEAIPCLKCGHDLSASVNESWEWVVCPACDKGFDTRQVRANKDRGYIRAWEVVEILFTVPLLLAFWGVMAKMYWLVFDLAPVWLGVAVMGLAYVAGNMSRWRAARLVARVRRSHNKDGERSGTAYWLTLSAVVFTQFVIAAGYIAAAYAASSWAFDW